MKTLRMRELISMTLLACSVQACQAHMPAGLECSTGYSAFRLRPSSRGAQTLDGVFVGGAYRLDRSWSVEASLTMQTGMEADYVDLQQWMIMVGPRYTFPPIGRWSGFAHFLAGRTRLKGSTDTETAQKVSGGFGPGLGVDFAVTEGLSLRCQGDYLVTTYGDKSQQNLSCSLGVVIRK